MPRIRIQFDCPECENPCSGEIDVSYPDFSAEKAGDMGVYETEEWRCETCDAEFEIETSSEIHEISAAIVNHHNPVSVEELDDEEPPDDYVPPHDVHAEFVKSQEELQVLLISSEDLFVENEIPWPPDSLARMVFSQLVAVLEAYLADRLHREAIDNPKVKLRLAEGADILKNLTVDLKDVIADPGCVERKFSEKIKSALYHDLKKVKNLYQVAFRAKNVFPSEKNRQVLEDAINLRHDCVHRNGKDKDGEPQEITVPKIFKTAAAMRDLVEHIEKIIAECSEKDVEPEAKAAEVPDRSRGAGARSSLRRCRAAA